MRDLLLGKGNVNLRKLAVSLAVIFIIGVAIINIGYLFEGSLTPISEYSFKSDLLSSLPSFLPGWFPLALPKDYLLGFDDQKVHFSLPTYLAGNFSKGGVWYYFPVAFVLKTPIPILIIFLWGIITVLYNRSRRKGNFLFLYISSFIVLYFFFFFSAPNIGIRYFLPIYPLLFLLCGSVLKEVRPKGKVALSLLSLWLITGTVLIYPHYLSYFNEFAGGPTKGYRYLADSNIDWGQDLISLKRYMKKNNLDRIYLSHFGLVSPSLYGIRFRKLPESPVHEVIAISVNHLLGIAPWKRTGDSYKWLRDLEVSDRAGYSILIYRIGSKKL